jgi:hypothetical protein
MDSEVSENDYLDSVKTLKLHKCDSHMNVLKQNIYKQR